MRRLFVVVSLLLPAAAARAETWTSTATGGELTVEVFEPATPAPDAPPATIIYLLNLAAPRVGTESDAAILADFRAAGHLVVTLDYAHHPRARPPWINADLAALRHQIRQKTFPTGRTFDRDHVFIVPSGHRLRRGVVFHRDAARTCALDILYPSQPARPVGAVLEFSCDNADRMGAFSLDFCSDTLLPAAAIEGFAAAMADHPVPAPYQSLDPMPDVARKAKAAVRTLRAAGAALGLNGRIVPAGFSRGSGMALLLATTAGLAEFDGFGEHPGVPSDVQGAVVMSGRFTYLDLRDDDRMLERYTKAWGDRVTHEDVWRLHGALDFLRAPTVPLFLTINVTESPDALHQMEVLRRRLTALGSPFAYHPETEPRGHKMPLAPEVLGPLFRYLQGQLQVPAASQP